MTKLINYRRGIASILIVFLVAMFSILIIASWQSRVLLSIHRGVSLTDNLAATYHAESDINDVISRVLGEYPLPPSGTRTLPDGTVLTLARTVSGDTETIEVHAKRQFASTKIELTKTTSEISEEGYEKIEIILAPDCTLSMAYSVDPSCSMFDPNCDKRIGKQKEALINFIDGISSLPDEEEEKYYLGILPFKIGYKWLVEPTNNYPELRTAVQGGFDDKNPLVSSACDISLPTGFIPNNGETSLGTPAVFSSEYFRGTADPKTKQVFILITDGVPNISRQHPSCGTTNGQCGEGGSCTQGAINYLTCGVADTNTLWDGVHFGLRDQEVDTYGVTIISKPDTEAKQAAYDQTVSVFKNNNYFTEYLPAESANDLSDKLMEILEKIKSTVTTFEIQRVVPTPVR